MFIHLNRLYSDRDIELYALVPHSYLLLLQKRPVRGLRVKRLYIGAYGTFKFKSSYIYRYVWIDNFHGYLLVSKVVWRECYTAVWRTIYSSKFAYFGKIYRRVFICIWNNSVIILHTIALMTIPQSGAFQIVQKECSFIWIGWIVAEI